MTEIDDLLLSGLTKNENTENKVSVRIIISFWYMGW